MAEEASVIFGVSLKKQLFVTALLLALCSALAGLLVESSSANPYVPASNSAKVRLRLPVNRIYGPNSVPLLFTVESPYPDDWEITSVYGIKVYLDGDSCENVMPLTLEQKENYVYSSNLTELKNGCHSLYVVAYVSYKTSEKYSMWIPDPSDGSASSNVVYFQVDATPPSISILSAQNKNYGMADIAVNFTVNEQVSWLGYSVDGKTNITATWDATLTHTWGVDNYRLTLPKLPEGLHTLTVYANDTYGNMGASETLHFSVAEETKPQQSVSFPASLVTIAVGAVLAATFGLMGYFLRSKRKRSTR